jgi:hypothetical protein
MMVLMEAGLARFIYFLGVVDVMQTGYILTSGEKQWKILRVCYSVTTVYYCSIVLVSSLHIFDELFYVDDAEIELSIGMVTIHNSFSRDSVSTKYVTDGIRASNTFLWEEFLSKDVSFTRQNSRYLNNHESYVYM